MGVFDYCDCVYSIVNSAQYLHAHLTKGSSKLL